MDIFSLTDTNIKENKQEYEFVIKNDMVYIAIPKKYEVDINLVEKYKQKQPIVHIDVTGRSVTKFYNYIKKHCPFKKLCCTKINAFF